ncbi:metallo-beta-lactamase class B [Variovorax paradoxus]|jgi:metallo-beta-lactamase class B|uniref:MBL fold metallo-hydrolase n=1 Tax=Variovorax paradoxus TaxID=34073 RepID=UPI002794DD80|nr:MBL fold metallo-hydrolase [Variovorax paradoxus]MDQ0573541.1 metallo-beta-lactamase class B [Variovorax paradoxus]
MAQRTNSKTGFLLKTTALAAVVALAQGCAQTAAQRQAPSNATVATHVAVATRAAGPDLTALLTLCQPAPAARPPQAELDKGLAAFIARPAPPPGQAFDNLYFVGADWVSAWAIKTSDGIILIDALNTQAEAAALIEGGMRKLGLDPAQIKYVIVTHGHGDHYGGAPYLAQKYRARVVMSEADWTMTETRLEFATPIWGAPPKRGAGDVSAKDGDRITLGDTSVTLYLTPGHTMGTLSPVFEVTSNGQKHRAMLWGGTGFNFGKDVPRLDAYIGATQRMGAIVQTQRIDVLLSNHSNIDGSQAKLAALRQQPAPAANPFVLGTPTVERALAVMGECAQAQRDRFLLQ